MCKKKASVIGGFFRLVFDVKIDAGNATENALSGQLCVVLVSDKPLILLEQKTFLCGTLHGRVGMGG